MLVMRKTLSPLIVVANNESGARFDADEEVVQFPPLNVKLSKLSSKTLKVDCAWISELPTAAMIKCIAMTQNEQADRAPIDRDAEKAFRFEASEFGIVPFTARFSTLTGGQASIGGQRRSRTSIMINARMRSAAGSGMAVILTYVEFLQVFLATIACSPN
jgi:hypothetical protein